MTVSTDVRRVRRRTCVAAAAALATAVALAAPVAPSAATAGSQATRTAVPVSASAADRPAVVARRVYGRSERGRPLRAWRLGEPDAARTVVAIATMHGDEPAPRHTLMRLRDGRPIRGVDLWVLPNVNPDGLARGSRYNANGVDLNRNFPARWRARDRAGRRPASARETRSLMRFLRNVAPDRIVSFHQPLYGVDTYQSKAPAFARRLADAFRLPRKNFDCGAGCHGTMTQWFNRRFAGACVTVEYRAHPRRRYVNRFAPRALLRAVGGRRVGRAG